jgi:hypothetical protein
MIRILLLLFVGSVLLSSCNQTNQKYDKPYFDFDSLIDAQVHYLVNAQVSVYKKSIINGKKDSTSFIPDSLKLANELDVFRQIDLINKPLYRKAFEIKEGEKDTKSNLLIRSYTARESSPVPFIKFYYTSSNRALKKIETLFQEENSLYDTRRNLILKFDDSSGSVLLRSYHLSGTQKMILSDTVNFSVDVYFSSDKH